MKNEATAGQRRTWGVFYPIQGQAGIKVIEIADGLALSETYRLEIPIATYGRRSDAIRRALHESLLDCDVRGCKRCSGRGEAADETITQGVARLRISEGR